MTRFATRTVQTLLDVGALCLVLIIAYLLRFEGSLPTHEAKRIGIIMPYVVALQYGGLYLFNIPRFSWRYVGLREATRIFYAMAAGTIALLSVRYGAQALQPAFPTAGYALVPTGVILINFVVGFCAIAGLRVVRRLVGERAGKTERENGAQRTKTILVGAGNAGVITAREIESHPNIGIQAVGFVDDDPVKRGSIVQGLPVLGATGQLKELCKATGAEQALITIAGAGGKDIRRIVELCEDAGIPVKIIPGIHEIVGGRVNLSSVRNVAIEDLLRREPVELDSRAIAQSVEGMVVLVTGAGGSIGSELCRQICGFKPGRLVLVERAENSLFEIHKELSERYADVSLVPLIADVCDHKRMDQVLANVRPSMVLHAAAHKHVPMMEWNPGEAIKNNVVGTQTIAHLADQHGVAQFVMISTDKAVNPSSMMGASKRIAEMYTQALSQRSKTKFITVRFGNVLGSAGSVVPVFKQQIAKGGPVTVTHPDMKRYFMTIPEASQLVLQAATMGVGGEIFILDMGEPVRIVQLAEDLISLSGLRPHEDIEIRFSGVRPGEKLFEELSVAAESADKTRHPKIFVGKLAPTPLPALERRMSELELLCDARDEEGLRRAVAHIVPEFQAAAPPQSKADPKIEKSHEDRASSPLVSAHAGA